MKGSKPPEWMSVDPHHCEVSIVPDQACHSRGCDRDPKERAVFCGREVSRRVLGADLSSFPAQRDDDAVGGTSRLVDMADREIDGI